MATTPTKPIHKFSRNQCVACNKVIGDQCHPVLIFGQTSREIASKFESLTGISLNASDSFPKKICVPCINKLESAVTFKQMCVNSRKEQESLLLERVKRGRNPGESPCSKRNPSKEIVEDRESCAGSNVVRFRPRTILPKTTDKPITDGDGKYSKVAHVLSKYGCAVLYCTVQYSTVQYSDSTAQHSTAQHSTAQPSTAQHSTVLYCAVLCCTVH